jgi:TonB family protein
VAALERGDAVASYAALDLRDATEVRLQEFLPRDLCLRGADLGVVVLPGADPRVRFFAGLRRFLNLGRTLAHLDAPGLISVAECWSMSGTGYLVATAHPAQRLDTWKSRLKEPPSELTIWRGLQRILTALDALHSVHCLHLEVAPQRIAIDDQDRPILLEYNSAWRLLDTRSPDSRARYQAHFAAPELQDGSTTGARIGTWTDIYALAAVMHWLAAGEPPPRAADRVAGDAVARLTRLTAGRYSPALLDAIGEGLAMDLRVRAAWAGRWRPRLAHAAEVEESLPDLSSVMPPPRPSTVQAPLPLQKPPRQPWARAGRAALLGLIGVSSALAVAPIGSERALLIQDLKAPVSASSGRGPDVAAAPSVDAVADARPAIVTARRPIVAPRPEFPLSAASSGVAGGRVTAALDIGPGGNVLMVAVLASEPAGVFDSEVISALQRWRYDPTGSVERSTIDIIFKADAQ